MAHYTLQNLPKSITEDDCIDFYYRGMVYEYKVKDCYLQYIGGDHQQNCSLLLQNLNLDSGKFLRESYGYPVGHGFWPTFHRYDDRAAIRAVWNLYGEILKATTDFDKLQKEFINPTSLNRFKTKNSWNYEDLRSLVNLLKD